MSNFLEGFIRCFLCRKKSPSDKPHKSVDSCLCPASKKNVKTVLLHLARSGKFELHIESGEWLCRNCYVQIVDYDTTLVHLTRKQRCLSKLVEKAATSFDSDVETDCLEEMSHMEEFNDDHFFDDANISDREIAETIFDVIGGKGYKKQSSEKNLSQKAARHRFSDNYGIGGGSKKANIQCNLCAMRFKSRNILQKHVVNVHKKFSCTICSFSHRNEDYVMLHMNIHEGKNENQCRFCNKEFTTKISAIRHMEVHLDTKKYQCDKCGLCFSQTTVLYNHKLQHEAEEKPLRCDICNQIFKTKRTFRHHMVTHRADRPRYSCEHCGKTFTEKYTLKVHKRTHPESEEQTVVATSSQQIYIESDQQLQYDIQPTHQSYNHSQQLEFPEPSAPQQTNEAPSFTGGPKFGCIICDQHFMSKDLLNKHMEKEHDVILKSLSIANFTQYEVVSNESRKPCHICGQMFSAQHNLDYHLVQVHEVEIK